MGDSMSTIINATTTNGIVIQPDNSGSLVLQTNNGTTAVTIDTSQNVGIGTTTTTPANGRALIIYETTYPRLTLRNSTTGQSSNDGYGLVGVGNDLYVENAEAGNLCFTTSTTERMRIDSSGNIGLGVSNPTSPVTMLSGQNFNYGFCIRNTNGSSWEFVTGGDNKLYMGYAASGTPASVGNFATNGTYTATSDIRKKKDISYIFNGIDIVNSLKPAQGRMLEDDDTSPLRPMFIAQDMVDVIPALVSNLEPTPSDDPLLGVDYASIAPILVKAIQEQQTIINDLKARVETLEAK
jgi:hypothetical protein